MLFRSGFVACFCIILSNPLAHHCCVRGPVVADIFISYSKKDRLLAEQLGGLLQECGFTVWWDAELLPAKEFREEIRRQIQAARAVIVIWSENSAKSAFVIDEADVARESGKLISTLADGFAAGRVPLGFRNTHMTSLSDGDVLIRALASRGLATSLSASSSWPSSTIGLLGARTHPPTRQLLHGAFPEIAS